jgi:hypothetical protein
MAGLPIFNLNGGGPAAGTPTRRHNHHHQSLKSVVNTLAQAMGKDPKELWAALKAGRDASPQAAQTVSAVQNQFQSYLTSQFRMSPVDAGTLAATTVDGAQE